MLMRTMAAVAVILAMLTAAGPASAYSWDSVEGKQQFCYVEGVPYNAYDDPNITTSPFPAFDPPVMNRDRWEVSLWDYNFKLGWWEPEHRLVLTNPELIEKWVLQLGAGGAYGRMYVTFKVKGACKAIGYFVYNPEDLRY